MKPSLLLLPAFGAAALAAAWSVWVLRPVAAEALGPEVIAPQPVAHSARPAAERVAAPAAGVQPVPRAVIGDAWVAGGRPTDPRELERLRARGAEERELRRQRELLQRELEEIEWMRKRAEWIAAELDLEPGSGTEIARIWIEERDRQAAAWEESRRFETKREARAYQAEAVREIRAWREETLVRAFGLETAARIVALENGAESADGATSRADGE